MGATASKVLIAMAAAYLWHRLTAGKGGGTCPLMCSPWRALAVGAVFGLIWAWPARTAPAGGAAAGGSLSAALAGVESKETTMASVKTGVPVHVDEATFADLVRTADKPLLIDAYADWCGPCKMLAPELEKAAASLGDRAYVIKVNVDESPQAAAALHVRSIPALFVVKGDAIVDRWVGFSDAPTIIERTEKQLAAPVPAS